MTTRRNPFVKLVLLLIVAAALAVAGCGGDDGVSPSVHQDALDAQAAAEQKAAEEEAARLAAEKAAAEEAARLAEEKAAAEEAARLAEEKAAAEEAARIAAEQKAEADRLAAEAEAARIAAEQKAEADRLAAINTAQMILSDAEAALMALADDATDEMERDAQLTVEAAANALRDTLRMYGGSTADIDAAIAKAVTARNAAAALQAMITAAADAATAAQMEAINTAQTTLSDAEAALMALADDATDEMKRDAQLAVEMAAAALVTALEANEGTDDQIAAAKMKRDSAKMMADDLQTTITAAAEAAAAAQMLVSQRSAIADAITAATNAIAAVMDDSSDDIVSAADDAITAATAAIAAATGIPATETAANSGTVAVLMARLDSAKSSRQMAMDAAAQAERMAHIDAARRALTGAQDALTALADDATDEMKRDANRMVEAAAIALRDALRMYGGSTADIDAATRTAQAAKIQADNLQVAITARAEAAEQRRMEAISTARTTLSDAEAALMALADDATDEAKRDAQRAVEMAAAALVQVLTDNDGTAEEIASAEMKQASAKTEADKLHEAVTAAQAEAEQREMEAEQRQRIAGQRMAITNAISDAMTAIAAVDDDASNEVVMAADTAITDARQAITDATELSDAEKAAFTSAVDAHATTLASAKSSRQMAMVAAAEAERMRTISTAKAELDAAKMALMELDDDASDEDKLVAQRKVENAANDYRDVLRDNGGSTEQVNYAIEAGVRANVAAEALHARITQRQQAAEQRRMAAIDAAEMKVTEAQKMVDALTDDSTDQEEHDAYVALRDAAADLKMVLEDNEGTQEQIDDAESKREMAAQNVDPVMERLETDRQKMAITTAIADASTAVAAVMDDSDESVVMAAEQAVATAKKAIADATRLSDEVKTAHTGTVTALEGQLVAAKTSRTAAMEADKTVDMAAMIITAAKLYDGISMPTATDANAADTATGTGTRFAQHADAPNVGDIEVAIGDAASVFLSEDKKTMVPANHGWEGKRYTDPAGGDMYEAIVYSNVETPTMGRKFGAETVDVSVETRDYEYDLTSGELVLAQLTGAPENVALTGVTRTAGTETFELPDPNPTNADTIPVPGSFHGVSGTYSCDTNAGVDSCTAAVGEDGGFLLTGAWTFTPSNAEARVMDMADDEYASYGWWLRKAANDGDFTASAFHDELGGVADAIGLDALNGTATYMGGAAGKYALSSATGGTNDAGHFTARAILEANFTTNTAATAITGTIDMFIGADGKARDWEVALKGSPIGDTGIIGNDGTSTTSPGGTVWTIDATDADASGQWSGSLRNNGDDGVPQVATGTFYSTYGTAGRMVGGFGANEQP